MKNKLVSKARDLIEKNPDEALKIYQEIWKNYLDQFDSWDAYYALKAMRAAKVPNLDWAKELAEKFKDKVGYLYGWLIFDICVKGKNRTEILSYEKYIKSLPNLSPQKNLKENDTNSCPTTILILKLCEAHAAKNFNARIINDLLSNLDYNFLSNKPKTFKKQGSGEDESSSDLEKYFSLKTKALLMLKEYDTCIEYCNKGLELLEKFHYNNDTWFKMRIALSEQGLGNYEKSEKLLKELIESKTGNDKWFLYGDLAQVCFEQKNYKKAWEYAVIAALYGNEPKYLIKLFLLQARILFKLNRKDDGKIHAELIAAILKEQKWNEKQEYSKILSYYKIDRTKIPPLNDLIEQARDFWLKEKYCNISKTKGIIISIHKNGKKGRIKDQNNNLIDFYKKDLVTKIKTIENLKGATVEFFITETYDGKKKAESISIIEQPEVNNTDNLIGKTFDGKVKNVTEFGIFISIQGMDYGLLHKNNLPNELKNNFKEFFAKGKVVKVKIDKISKKGIQLKLADDI